MAGLVANLAEDEKEKYLVEIFNCYDVDHSGTISFSEFCSALRVMHGREISDKAVKLILEELDQDNDGELNQEEFNGFFRQLNKLKDVENMLAKKIKKGKVYRIVMICYFGSFFCGFCIFMYLYLDSFSGEEGLNIPGKEDTFAIEKIGLTVCGCAIFVGIFIGIILPICTYQLRLAKEAWANYFNSGIYKEKRHTYEVKRMSVMAENKQQALQQLHLPVSFSYRRKPFSFDMNTNMNILDETMDKPDSTIGSSGPQALAQSRGNSHQGSRLDLANTNAAMAMTWSSGFEKTGPPLSEPGGKYDENWYTDANRLQRNEMTKSNECFNPISTKFNAATFRYCLPPKDEMRKTWGPGDSSWTSGALPNTVENEFEDSVGYELERYRQERAITS